MRTIPALVVLLAASISFAQEQRPDAATQRPIGAFEALGKLQDLAWNVDLTEAQRDKIVEIVAKTRAELEKSTPGPQRRQVSRESATQLRTASESILALLSDEQKQLVAPRVQELVRGLGAGATAGRGNRNFIPLDEQLHRIIPELKVNDEQKTKLEAVAADFKTKSEAARNEGARDKLRTLREEATAQIKSTLNEEQFKKFEELMPRPDQFGQRGQMLVRFDEVVKQLKLTEEQSAKYDKLVADMRKQIEELRAAGPDGREKIQQAFMDFQGKLRDILTDEQREKLATLIQTRPQN